MTPNEVTIWQKIADSNGIKTNSAEVRCRRRTPSMKLRWCEQVATKNLSSDAPNIADMQNLLTKITFCGCSVNTWTSHASQTINVSIFPFRFKCFWQSPWNKKVNYFFMDDQLTCQDTSSIIYFSAGVWISIALKNNWFSGNFNFIRTDMDLFSWLTWK